MQDLRATQNYIKNQIHYYWIFTIIYKQTLLNIKVYPVSNFYNEVIFEFLCEMAFGVGIGAWSEG